MPSISQTIKFRNQRRTREKHDPIPRIGLVIGLCICLLGILGSLAAVFFYTSITRNLPPLEALPALLEPPGGKLLQPTRLFDRNKEHELLVLENPAASGKRYLYLPGEDGGSQFSPYLIDAIVALYEPGFWTNSGYSLSGWLDGSHPTIAQWLVSDLVLDNEPASIKRNIRERLLAAQVTARYGREKILEWYLNSLQFGNLIFGADAAAQVYYGKSAAALDLAEAAMLTAASETPGITPVRVSQLLKQQQEQLIWAMLAQGSVGYEEADQALAEPIEFIVQPAYQTFAPGFTAYVLIQLSREVPINKILRGGYEIVTSLDYDLQVQVECTLRAQSATQEGNPASTSNSEDAQCEMAQLLPTPDEGSSSISGVSEREVVIIDPKNGQILAMTGECGTGIGPALPAEHSSGTILAPFLYVTAFARGMSPGTLLWDIPAAKSENLLDSATIDTPGKIFTVYHGPVRARMALVNDYPAASQEVLRQVGSENFQLTKQRFGINVSRGIEGSQYDLTELYSQAASLVDIVTAYGILANQGVLSGQPEGKADQLNDVVNLAAASILQVRWQNGTTWLDQSVPQTRPIINQSLAYLVTHVLKDEEARRQSLGHPNLLEIGQPVAVKAGRSLDGQGGWVVGYTPQYAVGVWEGNTAETTGEFALDQPMGLWNAVMKFISKSAPVEDFQIPAGLSLIQVCDPSGLLPTDLCPSIVQEIFLTGSEPTQKDDLFKKFSINRETGLLATIFTPVEMVEDKIYLVVPPQAVEWAKAEGIPIPPDSYDTIFASSEKNDAVNIISPQISDHIGGVVKISGSATGSDFDYYRLQVGRGLNPKQWFQIGEDQHQPVQEGFLGEWDTKGLEGLYILQLLVVRQDKRIEQANLQVSVDNLAPEVEILAPTAGERYSYTQGETIMMQASPSDNLEVGKLEFFVDGDLKASLVQAPFVIITPSIQGTHTLKVKAYDLAGNMGESSVTFFVDNK